MSESVVRGSADPVAELQQYRRSYMRLPEASRGVARAPRRRLKDAAPPLGPSQVKPCPSHAAPKARSATADQRHVVKCGLMNRAFAVWRERSCGLIACAQEHEAAIEGGVTPYGRLIIVDGLFGTYDFPSATASGQINSALISHCLPLQD
jgi:hypothetical protein